MSFECELVFSVFLHRNKKIMTKKETNVKKIANTTTIEEPMGKYINPLTDFGFKHIFGIKDLLINFLNAVLKIEGGIMDLHYDNTVKPGRSEEDRTNIFDLFCTTGKGERIIIEMHNHRQEYFKDRALYYASCSIQEQNVKGKGWNYMLSPVYSVNIVNFRLDKPQKAKYASYIQLMDIDTHQVFNKKLTFVFMELPCFTKKEHELKTGVEQWMYVLKYLPELDNLPKTLCNEVFEKLFFMAEIAKLSKAKRKDYDNSLKRYRNMNLAISERDRKISERDRKISERDRIIVERDGKIVTLSNQVADQAAEIARLNRMLRLNSTRTSKTILAKPARTVK
jgi:predicted transposase/invertase (TIGR01784 family)